MEEEEMKTCQNCQQPFPSYKIDLHEAYCRRNIRKCTLCSKMVDINDEDNHNNQFHIQKPCEYCHIPVETSEMAAHLPNCRERPVECKFCQNPNPFSKIQKHQQQCGSRTRLCEKCHKYIKINAQKEHFAKCQGEELLRHESQQMRRLQQNQNHRDRMSNNNLKKEIRQAISPRLPKHSLKTVQIEPQPISQLVDPLPISIRLAVQRQREKVHKY